MRSDPLGIDDPRPGLSWQLTGPAGPLQSAYQVIVASTLEKVRANTADLWDSGRTPGAACTGVAYGGPALSSRQRCFWRVRVWDGAGQVSDWSAPAAWEMGLLDDADWMGDWLAVESQVERDDREAGARWVSGTTASRSQPCTFRLAFQSGGGEGLLTIIADGKLSKLALDGDPIALPARGPNGYGDPPAIAFPLVVGAGAHVLTAEVVT